MSKETCRKKKTCKGFSVWRYMNRVMYQYENLYTEEFSFTFSSANKFEPSEQKYFNAETRKNFQIYVICLCLLILVRQFGKYKVKSIAKRELISNK